MYTCHTCFDTRVAQPVQALMKRWGVSWSCFFLLPVLELISIWKANANGKREAHIKCRICNMIMRHLSWRNTRFARDGFVCLIRKKTLNIKYTERISRLLLMIEKNCVGANLCIVSIVDRWATWRSRENQVCFSFLNDMFCLLMI